MIFQKRKDPCSGFLNIGLSIILYVLSSYETKKTPSPTFLDVKNDASMRDQGFEPWTP